MSAYEPAASYPTSFQRLVWRLREAAGVLPPDASAEDVIIVVRKYGVEYELDAMEQLMSFQEDALVIIEGWDNPELDDDLDDGHGLS